MTKSYAAHNLRRVGFSPTIEKYSFLLKKMLSSLAQGNNSLRECGLMKLTKSTPGVPWVVE